MTPQDPDLAELRALPNRDADRATASRVGKTALAEFRNERELASLGFFPALGHRGARFAVPAVLASIVVIYLAWSVQVASSLYP
jgi:hypothetical protein